MSISRGMDGEGAAHTMEISLSHSKKKKKIMPFAATRMQLSIILVEIS